MESSNVGGGWEGDPVCVGADDPGGDAASPGKCRPEVPPQSPELRGSGLAAPERGAAGKSRLIM